MTSLPQPNPDPDFNINTATNTFYKALADRLKSGQMTLDQARAAQAEMRALQLNPAAANRQAATDIAQRHLQVGQYSPANVAAQQAAQQPQGGLTLAKTAQGVGGTGQSFNPVTAPPSPPRPPEEIMVTPQRMPEIVAPQPPMPQPPMSVMPPPPPVVYDTFRPTTPPSMPSAPPHAPLFDRNASLKQLNETFGNLRNTYGEDALRSAGLTPGIFQGFQKTMRELQLNNNSTQDQHTAALQNAYNTMNSFTNNLTPRQLPAPPQGVGKAPQMTMLPKTMPQAAVAPPTSAPQGMAMGGLLRKYYGGGMC